MPDQLDAADLGMRPVAEGGMLFCGVSEEAFAIQGVTYSWPKGSRLAWGLGFSRLGPLSDMDCKDAITEALKEVSACCDVTHEYVSFVNKANIKIIVQRLDGPSGTLADCQIPVGNVSVEGTQLLMRIDDGEQWGLFENPPPGKIDFYRVALHELLHAHGLGHKPANINAPALIAPVYNPRMRNLQDADRSELVRRYGPAKQAPAPSPTPSPSEITGRIEVTIGGRKYAASGPLKPI